MKKALHFSTVLVLLTAITTGIHAQQAAPSELRQALQPVFDQFDTCTNTRQKQALGARISGMAVRYDNQWAVHYYNAYCKAILSSYEREDDRRDAILDEADKEYDRCVSLLGHETDETHVLAALIANWRIAISPMSRMDYIKAFREHMRAAQAINAANPRIYYLQGMAKYSMPKFAGGGKDAALPLLSKADSLFRQETVADIFKPYWGKIATGHYLAECRKGD